MYQVLNDINALVVILMLAAHVIVQALCCSAMICINVHNEVSFPYMYSNSTCTCMYICGTMLNYEGNSTSSACTVSL